MNDHFCQEDDATITDSNTTHCKEQLILTSDEEDDEGDSAENIIGTLLINKYCLMDINWAHVLTHSLTFVLFPCSFPCGDGGSGGYYCVRGTAVLKSSTSRNLFPHNN